jgi:hypothetical protein
MASISKDGTAADNLEKACDGTTYNIGGGAVVAASVTANVSLADVETGLTDLQFRRLILAVLAGKADATTPGTVVFKRKDGSTTAVTVAHDTSGNRTTITIGTL